MKPEDLLSEQVEYYRARAPEYDQWWERAGIYHLSPELDAAWVDEVAEVEALVDDFAPAGEVLELAAGTGIWSRRLVRHASALTCIDASPETLAINRTRTAASGVPAEYVVADMFSWWPTRRYDVVFFSFWLSHVPPERFEWFWSLVDAALVPGGRFLFLDNAAPFERIVPDDKWREDHLARAAWVSREVDKAVSERRLRDGRTFNIVKVFYEPAELEARLRALGWDATVDTTATFFIHGSGTRR